MPYTFKLINYLAQRNQPVIALIFFTSLFLICISPVSTNAQKNDKEFITNLILESENLLYDNIDSSEILIDNALNLAIQSDYKWEIAKAKKQKGLILYFRVRFSEALNLFIESYELFQLFPDTEEQAAALNLIAIVYSDQGRNDEALVIYKEILNIIDSTNISRKATTLNNIGVTYRDLGDKNKCYEYYSKAFKIIQDNGDTVSESHYSTNLGSLFISLNNPDSALYYALHGLDLALKVQNNHRIANSYEILGNFYYWQKDYNKALEYYKLAFEYANKIEIVYEISTTAEGLSKTFAALGNYQKAFEYMNIQKVMDDSVKQKDIASHITEIELEKIFNRERELNKAINDKNRLLRNIYFIIVIAIFIIAGILFYSYNQKKKSYSQLKDYSQKLLLQKLEIEKQAHELTKLGSFKDKLFSIISHDLRSPLTSLLTILHMTKDNKFSKEEYHELLNETLKNVNYTTNMVDNLLNWASSQQKGIKLYPINLLVYNMIQNLILHFESQLSQKNIQIINELPKQLKVFADENMLNIVLRNLISNAIKFSYENTKIIASAKQMLEQVQIEIQDHGIGLSDQLRNNLFHNIVDSKRGTNNEKGTGLGLMLCKDLIEINNGSIKVESTEGIGSTFIILLPSAII